MLQLHFVQEFLIGGIYFLQINLIQLKVGCLKLSQFTKLLIFIKAKPSQAKTRRSIATWICIWNVAHLSLAVN